MSRRPLAIAVVGHTNAGKTSLLRTLTRRRDFGEVSARPGTTRHVETIALRGADGSDAIRFFDTPGLEDSVALWAFVQTLDGVDRPARIRAFLAGPEARAAFEQEAKVLRQLLDDTDAAFHVIDSREPVLPKHRAELELLNSCARPLMPVLNFVRDPASRAEDWQQALAAAGLHAQTRFDAVAPFVGAERQLYQDLAALLPACRAQLQAVSVFLDQERGQRREADARLIAATLLHLAALRRELPEGADPVAAERELQQLALQGVRDAANAMLDLHGFRPDDLRLTPLPWQDGRWDRDLFHPDALLAAGRRLGLGAAIGASLGVVADLAVGGLSLGAGAAVGSALGSLASQGWRQIGAKIANQLKGVRELSLGDPLLFLAAGQLAGLARSLELRGHAALDTLVQDARIDDTDDGALKRAIQAVQPARSRPDWASRQGRDERFRELVDETGRLLAPALRVGQ